MTERLSPVRRARTAPDDGKPRRVEAWEFTAYVQFFRRVWDLAQKRRELFRGERRQIVLHGVILYTMLDIKFIRENKDIVAAGAKKKRIDVDLDRLLSLDDKRRELQAAIDGKRAEQTNASPSITGEKDAAKKKEIIARLPSIAACNSRRLSSSER